MQLKKKKGCDKKKEKKRDIDCKLCHPFKEEEKPYTMENMTMNLEGWQRDTNIYFNAIETLVKQRAVALQKQVQETAKKMLQQLHEEKALFMQHGAASGLDATEEKGDAMAFPTPLVDLTDYTDALDKASRCLDEMKPTEGDKQVNNEVTHLGLEDPNKEITEGQSMDAVMQSQWAAGSGLFSMTLVDPTVEKALAQFSMQTRINMVKNQVQSFAQMDKDPEIGELVLTADKGRWFRAQVVDLKPHNKRVRVRIVDYGSLEALDYGQLWPFMQELGRDEPFQMTECTILEETDPKHKKFIDARYYFNNIAKI